MRNAMLLGAALACVAILSGCPPTSSVECVDQTSCDLAAGGSCTVAPSGSQWCAYPDISCPGGLRYSDQRVGDGLSGVCVGDDPVDAGVDAAVDAVPGTWSSPVKLAISTDLETEECPSVSADGLQLHFTGLGTSEIGGYDTYYVTRPNTGAPWGTTRTSIALANTFGGDEFGPNLDFTATEFFFERSGTLYRKTRSSATSPWSGSPLSLGFQGRFPNVSSDGLTLYYLDPAASCPAGTCRSRRTRADRTANWGQPTVEQLSSAQFASAFVSGDGLRVLFAGPPANTVAEASRASTAMPWGATRPINGLLGGFLQYARWNWAEDEMYLAGAGIELGTYDVYQSTLERP